MTTTQIGELAVRRSIEIDATPERVWEEFASAERFGLWYTTEGGVDMPCRSINYEPRVDGPFETEVDHGDVHYSFGGKVLVYDPPNELTVEMGPIEFPGVSAVSMLTFRLTETAGGTRVEIIHHAFERFGAAAREAYDAFERGWELTQLEALRDLVQTGRATG
jgi:uncharacterized protein YndB with AHSA1/START domain